SATIGSATIGSVAQGTEWTGHDLGLLHSMANTLQPLRIRSQLSSRSWVRETASSPVPQGFHRIHARSATGGQVAGHKATATQMTAAATYIEGAAGQMPVCTE